MSKEILINDEHQEKRVVVTNQGRMEEFYIERPQDKTIVGNIYKGRIDTVLPSIGGAFVDIGLPKKGFLYLSEIEDAFEVADTRDAKPKDLKKGQEVLVQVVKESFGTKGPRLSCNIGLAGRYIVLTPTSKHVGISRRIEDETERKRLKEILHEPRIPKDVGFIVRTAACGKSRQEIYRDAFFLRKMWKRIEKNVQQAKPASLIYEEYDLVLRVIRDSFTDDVTRLIVDSKDEFYRIQRFMKSFLAYLVRKVELYKGADLFLDKDIERQISKTFDTRVYLKSKAHIVIEPTEGLVVIDVNSGGFKDRFSQEETAFKVNCEAAIEVAHQLRLRDLGGIIVIDFIDMEKESHRRQVLNVLKSSLEPDRAKYDILGISKFGVVEMTRERVHNTVQTMTYQQCPYCHGKGKLRSSVTMAIYALKELRRFFKTKHRRQVNLVLHPSVAAEILKDKAGLLGVERRYRTKISLVSDPSVHVEEVKLTAVS